MRTDPAASETFHRLEQHASPPVRSLIQGVAHRGVFLHHRYHSKHLSSSSSFLPRRRSTERSTQPDVRNKNIRVVTRRSLGSPDGPTYGVTHRRRSPPWGEAEKTPPTCFFFSTPISISSLFLFSSRFLRLYSGGGGWQLVTVETDSWGLHCVTFSAGVEIEKSKADYWNADKFSSQTACRRRRKETRLTAF